MPNISRNAYDLCVIGCGPGGFAAAMSALDLGRHVCIVEAGEIGGTGVMWGALASKTMWELAKDYDIAAQVDRGYRTSGLMVDYRAVRDTVIQAVREKQYQMLSQIESFSERRWSGPGSLTYKRGWGSFVSPDKIAVSFVDGRVEEVRAAHYLIATGSTPRAFPGISLDHESILSSDTVLNLREFPKRLMIIGAGIVGCEYATIFSNFKQTKVYLVDYADRILPFEDDDIIGFVDDSLERNGVRIYHSAMLKDILPREKHLEVILDFADGHSEVVEVDVVLVSIGRVPNLARLDLAKAGISPDGKGYLRTDENCRLAGSVYAAGDVTHRPALVNLAEMEGRYAVKDMFGVPKAPMNYRNMSTVMFFKPAVAAVGLNERGCQAKKIPYRVARYSNAMLSRAIAMRATKGFVKIIVTDDHRQQILGMRAAGPQVSNTIMSIAAMMDQQKGVPDILKSVHPHPTMSESIPECLRLLEGKSVYKPRAFPEHLHIRTWHPETGYRD
jgi:dihydrolipoamide dehydrogenase